MQVRLLTHLLLYTFIYCFLFSLTTVEAIERNGRIHVLVNNRPVHGDITPSKPLIQGLKPSAIVETVRVISRDVGCFLRREEDEMRRWHGEKIETSAVFHLDRPYQYSPLEGGAGRPDWDHLMCYHRPKQEEQPTVTIYYERKTGAFNLISDQLNSRGRVLLRLDPNVFSGIEYVTMLDVPNELITCLLRTDQGHTVKLWPGAPVRRPVGPLTSIVCSNDVMWN